LFDAIQQPEAFCVDSLSNAVIYTEFSGTTGPIPFIPSFQAGFPLQEKIL
jgi:hypothetical protein